MQTQYVKKWGNSLAVRIPKNYADEARLEEGALVKITLKGRKLVIEPERKITLKDMLAAISPENLHGETDAGDAVGAEVW
jgi:antitoxin MazE